MQNVCAATPSSTNACGAKSSLGPFTAVAMDMDGTVLDPSHRLTEQTKDTLYELSTLGIHLIFATGRHHRGVDSTREDLLKHFKKKNDVNGASSSPLGGCKGLYVISSNGARVQNNAGEMIFSQDLDSDIVQLLYEHFGLRDHGDDLQELVSVSAYQTDIWWMNRAFANDDQMETKFGVIPELCPDILKDFPTKAVGKVSFRCNNPKTLREYETEINTLLHGRVTAVMSSETCLCVMAPAVSKAAALREIGKILNFDVAQDVIAFGNGMNDRDMLACVAKGCIMSNAAPRLKESLPQLEVVGSNAEEGVMRKLREVFTLSSNEDHSAANHNTVVKSTAAT